MGKRRRSSNTKLKVLEKDVLKTVVQYLELKNVPVTRLNNIGIPTESGGMRPVQIKGIPDLVVQFNVNDLPILVWIECKSTTGKQSLYQQIFEKNVNNFGGFYFIVRGVEDLEISLNSVVTNIKARIANG